MSKKAIDIANKILTMLAAEEESEVEQAWEAIDGFDVYSVLEYCKPLAIAYLKAEKKLKASK